MVGVFLYAQTYREACGKCDSGIADPCLPRFKRQQGRQTAGARSRHSDIRANFNKAEEKSRKTANKPPCRLGERFVAVFLALGVVLGGFLGCSLGGLFGGFYDVVVVIRARRRRAVPFGTAPPKPALSGYCEGVRSTLPAAISARRRHLTMLCSFSSRLHVFIFFCHAGVAL